MNELSLFDSLFGNSMDDVFGGYSKYAVVPKVDVTESDSAYNLDMELPGRTEKDVNIELDRSTLTISSRSEKTLAENDKNAKKEEKHEEKKQNKYLIRERRVSSFSRSFTIPEDVDAEKVQANFKNGILSIVMPRKALAAPKRIAIQCA